MKKMLKAAALIAAAAMVLGFVSCSDSDDAEDLGTLLVIKNKIDEADAAKEAAKKAAEGAETKSAVTTDSFDLQSPSSAITAIKGEEKTSNNKTTIGTQSLSADILEAGASGNLKLVLSAAGTGVGASIGSKQTTATTPKFLYVAPTTSSPKSKGLKIKYDALKIEGIKGKVKATISWYMPSKKKAGDRNLEVTVGSEATVSTANTDTSNADSSFESQKMPDYTVSFDGGEDGKTLYIGGSNEVNILSIKIEAQ